MTVKKFILYFAFILVLVGCADSDEQLNTVKNDEETNSNEGKRVEEESNNIETDGALDKEVFLPSTLFGDHLINDKYAEIDAEAAGAENIQRDDEGNITYTISSSAHQEMLEEYEDILLETIDDLEGEGAPSISKVIHDESFTEFTVEVDREAYEDSIANAMVLGLGAHGLRHQIFSGVDPETYGTYISVIDEDTGDLVDDYDLPGNFSNESYLKVE